MMATNYIGAFCLTSILLPLLEASPVASRVVNVSSFTHRSVSSMIVDRGAVISGNHAFTSECYPCAEIYEYTKLCILLFTYELHRQFGLSETSRAISVVAVDPGAVKTNIMREIPSLVSRIAFFGLNLLGLLHHPEQGVRPIVDAALASPEVSGVYFFGGNGRTINSSALSYDPKLSKDLWATSNEIFRELQLAHR
ncbi:dehydrogenase [Lithospermum erythrorhizon]|uniref:Dehydrogenase n=1 Tax=Lithospermum erythrorhizon TaxID=34254 RepID=A0AAV3PSJ7_LITER